MHLIPSSLLILDTNKQGQMSKNDTSPTGASFFVYVFVPPLQEPWAVHILLEVEHISSPFSCVSPSAESNYVGTNYTAEF